MNSPLTSRLAAVGIYTALRLVRSTRNELKSTTVPGAAIIGGTGGHVPPQHFGWGDAKVYVSPLIAHLVKFLGHIFHLD